MSRTNQLNVQLFGKDILDQIQKDESHLVLANYKITSAIELNSTRGEPSRKIQESLDEKDIVEFEFDDGTIWVSPSQEISTLFQNQGTNRSQDGNMIIPNTLDIPTNNRGIFKKVYLKFVKIFKPEKVIETAAEIAAEVVAAKVESAIVELEGVNHLDSDFKLKPFQYSNFNPSINLDKPTLLFLHGTCSSTMGSFGEIKGTEMWEKVCTKYGENILALEHRTWTKSPFENALQVLEALPAKTKLHLVSHSRGGIVGDVLARCCNHHAFFTEEEMLMLENLDRKHDADILRKLNEVSSEKQIEIKKFVRVACPAAGTTILSGRMDHFLNIVLNLIGGGLALAGQAKNPIFLGIRSLLIAMVNQRKDASVLPGLEAMVPNSPLLKILNNHQIKIESDLAVIAGNAGIGGVKKTLATLLMRLFYKLDNDFVVDTDSMYMGAVRENKIYYKFVESELVDHFSYFKNINTRTSVLDALSTPSLHPIPNFKEVTREEKNRNITTVLPGGSVYPQAPSFEKPIVILVPGIMGSNLYEDDTEIWIDYRKMALGSLTNLFIQNKRIEARSLVGSAYGTIVENLSEKYDVVVFPYDWRKPLMDSGKRLANKIKKELLPKIKNGQTIQIVAHSMGGLVVRDMMMNHTSLWNQLNKRSGFRCLLLGTPWQGSYLIPEIITGIGSRIKSISRLALFQSRKELLEVFVQYPGLLQLLPTFEGAHEFENIQLWEALQETTDATLWTLPKQKDLDDFATYKNKVRNFDNWNLEKVYYIAGKADSTVSNFVCTDYTGFTLSGINIPNFLKEVSNKDIFTRFKLKFKGTPKGDGSVTWEHGIPSQLQDHQVFYMPTGHGELANDTKHFEAIKDILATGSTSNLSKTPPATRAMAQEVFVENKEVFTNDVNILAKQILGLNTRQIYQSKAKIQEEPIKVTVKNGHLRYSKFPLMVGHFKGDGIVSAEAVVDALLQRKLSQREAIGLYPGPIGTNLVHLPDKKNDLGAIIVGIGGVEQLTPYLLSKTIELGCLEYILSVNKNGEKKKGDYIGISTLLIGSRYANLSLTNSINAILEGIINANKKINQMNEAKSDLPIISEIEFVELYKDRADDTFYQLHQINHNNSFYNIQLEYPINEVDGARSYIPLSDEKEWWKRITALVKTDPINQSKYLGFSASTGRAVVEVRESFTNLQIIDALLNDNKKQTNWDRELTKTIFELLIPNDFKISFRNQQNILLILDKMTASFPWELLNYDENLELPIVVSAGMIRQLASGDDRRKIKPVNNKKALIIGDPVLDQKSGIPQLPEARVEASIVDNLLNQNNYKTTTKINEPFKEIFKKLYDEYKIIHIASHGVIDYGEDKKTGILLSDNIVLTAAEINQISSTPELVFINSCYMGQVNPEKEEHFRSKYKLAANIGVQFIENGVKAVVVAGWAVNDDAAKRFAQVFYEEMLNGEMFSEAVKAARSACFREFPNTNTWGAYQCYGDQFYTLQKKKYRNQDDEPYILEKEILIDLENIIDATKSSRKRKYNFVPVLGKISKRIDASGLRNAIISEMEIKAYLELGRYDIAFEKYDQLFKEPKADYSVSTLEQWCSNKMKYLQDIYDDELESKGAISVKTAKSISKEMKVIISRMNYLLDLGRTAERHYIMASIQKRYSMILSNKKERIKALKNAATHYKKGFELSKEVYPLTSWVILESIINDSKSLESMNNLLENDPLEYIKKELQNIVEKEKDEKEFWDQVRPVNLKQAKLLFFLDNADEDFRRKLVEEIKVDYRLAWKLGGASKRHKLSEIFQMEFMRDSLLLMESIKPENEQRDIDGIIDALNELIDFFEELR